MIPHAPRLPVYGIVPAAGLGRRMGRPKQTLPYWGSTITGRVARTLLDAELDAVVVVTRSELVVPLGLPSDRRLSVAVNDNESSQMIDSIRIALSTLLDDRAARGDPNTRGPGPVAPRAECAGILVVPGDMPRLAVATCRLCVEAYRREPTRIVVAAQNGQRGHPLIFPAALREAVSRLDCGLNTLLDLHRDRVRVVETEDPATIEDIDTPARYESLLLRGPPAL